MKMQKINIMIQLPYSHVIFHDWVEVNGLDYCICKHCGLRRKRFVAPRRLNRDGEDENPFKPTEYYFTYWLGSYEFPWKPGKYCNEIFDLNIKITTQSD